MKPKTELQPLILGVYLTTKNMNLRKNSVLGY